MIAGKTFNSSNFQTLFEAALDFYLVLAPDYKIVAASDNYLQARMNKRENVLGRYLFEVFPDDPDVPVAMDTKELKVSLNKVLANKQVHVMAIQKFELGSDEGAIEEQYWHAHNIPVKGADGEILYIIHRVEEVTHFVKSEKVQQAQQLEEVRALASGLVHDFNNVLAIMMLSCGKLLNSLELSQEVMSDINQISLSAKKAATLTRQLRVICRK